MRIKSVTAQGLAFAMGCLLFAAAPGTYAAQDHGGRHGYDLEEEVRHQLVMLPYYNVFDWLEAQVQSDGTVTLKGEVTRPSTKDDADRRVKSLEGASHVVDNVEVLPLSPTDDQIRLAVYRAIFAYSSPLFRYATQSVPPIHIIVRNGNVTLKGVVANQGDSDIAYVKASQVSSVFSVKNELQVEGRTGERVS